MENAKEARRKRLTERRTDRLAFIIGQNQNLGQPAPQHDLHPAEAFGEGTTALQTTEHDPGVQKPEEEKSDPQLASNFTGSNNVDDVSTLRRSSSRDVVGAEDSAPPSTRFAIFAPTEIGRAVVATENLRVVAAFVVAFVVVLCHRGLPVGGGRTLGSTTSFRPLCLVLLTDVMMILGWVFLNGRHEKDGRSGGEGWPGDLAMVLELGQMLLKVLGAAFMDCSICAVLMICGFVV